jgi:hypothetical protein
MPPPAAMAAPEISLSPSEGGAGETVDIEGSGFALVSSVEITFGGVPVEDVVTVLGAFETSFEVPQSQPGEYEVVATDSAGNSASAEFTILNDPPVAHDAELSIDEGQSVEIALSATDANGDTLTFAIEKEPSHGALQDFDSEAGTVTYVPEAGYAGDDDFEFSASDGMDDSNTAKVSITVVHVNGPPTAEPQSVSVDEGHSIEITLAGSDPEGDELTFSISTAPAHGSLEDLDSESGTVTYVPDAGYSGTDSFEFVVSDGESDSEPATVGITIVAPNSPPVAADVEAETDEDESVTVYLSANDPDSDEVTFSIESGAAHGSVARLEQTGPMSATVVYRPQDNYHGTDSFTFVADDGELESEVATVEVTINPVNDAPEAENQSATVEAGESVEITLRGSDVDGDELEFLIVEGPERGTLGPVSSVDDGSAVVTYTPGEGEHGQDVFTFRASDGEAQSEIATVSIIINAPAPAPAPEEPGEAPVQQAPDDAASGDLPGGASGDQGDGAPEDGASQAGNEVPVPDVTPDDVAQGAALQSLSTGTVVQGENFASSPAAWLIPGALLGVASAVALMGYRKKSLKKGMLAVWDRLLGLAAQLGLVRREAVAQSGTDRPPGRLSFLFNMNKIRGILDDEKGKAAREQILGVAYGGARASPQEYESSKSVAKKQFEQIGSILRAKPALQGPYFESFGEMTVKVWWAIKEEVSLDGRKGMQWESLEWLGSETEKYWARQSSKDSQA